eukprot:239449-Chlamydomonas_euryale.AAC.1
MLCHAAQLARLKQAHHLPSSDSPTPSHTSLLHAQPSLLSFPRSFPRPALVVQLDCMQGAL